MNDIESKIMKLTQELSEDNQYIALSQIYDLVQEQRRDDKRAESISHGKCIARQLHIVK